MNLFRCVNRPEEWKSVISYFFEEIIKQKETYSYILQRMIWTSNQGFRTVWSTCHRESRQMLLIMSRRYFHVMFIFTITLSNGNIFRVTGPLCGEFTGPGEFLTQRPVTQSFDVFFDRRLNIRLSKQPWGWWFETPPWSLWRHCNVMLIFIQIRIHGLLNTVGGISNIMYFGKFSLQ